MTVLLVVLIVLMVSAIAGLIFASFFSTRSHVLCDRCRKYTGVLFHIEGKTLCSECLKADAMRERF